MPSHKRRGAVSCNTGNAITNAAPILIPICSLRYAVFRNVVLVINSI